MAQQANIQQLLDAIGQLVTAQQQQQINQPNPNINVPIPVLPDISVFEPTDEKGRITEWIERFSFAMDCSAPNATDAVKVKALMNKLSETAFSEYSKSCLPAKVTDFDFNQSTERLQKLFAKPQSVFIDRYECLMASKTEGEDFRQFVNRHKRLLNDFKFTSLKEEQFKVLMLLTALKSPKDATLRQRILSKLGADGDNVKYDEIVQDCINFMTTISEAKLIESSAANRSINAVKPKWHKTEKGGRPNNKQGQSSSAPAQQCWRCGWTNHSHWECKHKSAKCQKCSQNGHLEGQCDKVQEWRRRNKLPIPKRKIGNLRIGTAMKVNSASLFKTDVAVDGKNIKFSSAAPDSANAPKVDACSMERKSNSSERESQISNSAIFALKANIMWQKGDR
ncbi:hypothetical protein niasHS_005976 [Heterodera schachtii]|uniref:DUF7083 domain-containing protein n=1 Tax=Heterodera schachtii TaxID=97005 RepID=A0ABD2JN29_HETSC